MEVMQHIYQYRVEAGVTVSQNVDVCCLKVSNQYVPSVKWEFEVACVEHLSFSRPRMVLQRNAQLTWSLYWSQTAGMLDTQFC